MQFGNIERNDGKAAVCDELMRARKDGRENHFSGERESIAGVRLGGIHVNPIVSRKNRRIEPAAVGEQSVFVKGGYGGF